MNNVWFLGKFSFPQGNLMAVPFSLGTMLVSVVAVGFTDWRWLELFLALSCLFSR